MQLRLLGEGVIPARMVLLVEAATEVQVLTARMVPRIRGVLAAPLALWEREPRETMVEVSAEPGPQQQLIRAAEEAAAGDSAEAVVSPVLPRVPEEEEAVPRFLIQPIPRRAPCRGVAPRPVEPPTLITAARWASVAPRVAPLTAMVSTAMTATWSSFMPIQSRRRRTR